MRHWQLSDLAARVKSTLSELTEKITIVIELQFVAFKALSQIQTGANYAQNFGVRSANGKRQPSVGR